MPTSKQNGECFDKTFGNLKMYIHNIIKALAAWSSVFVSACHRRDWSYWVVRSNPARIYGGGFLKIEKSII
jgi:hypothetical protein